MSPIHVLCFEFLDRTKKYHSEGERIKRSKTNDYNNPTGCQNVIDLPRHSVAKWKRNHDDEAVRNRMPTPFPHHHKLWLFWNAWPQLFNKNDGNATKQPRRRCRSFIWIHQIFTQQQHKHPALKEKESSPDGFVISYRLMDGGGERTTRALEICIDQPSAYFLVSFKVTDSKEWNRQASFFSCMLLFFFLGRVDMEIHKVQTPSRFKSPRPIFSSICLTIKQFARNACQLPRQQDPCFVLLFRFNKEISGGLNFSLV